MISRIRSLITTTNAVRYLLSFVLAFTLWAWVTAQRDPEQTYRANQLAITVVGLPDGLDLVGSLPTVDVRLQGPRSVIQTIDTGSVQATVDLSSANGPGAYSEKIHVVAPDGLREIVVTPDVVIVELDAVVSKSFPIDILTPQQVPRNLAVTSTTASPNEVQVTGVQRNVDRVARVVVDVSLGNQDDSFQTQAIPRPVDVNDQVVENVELSPSTVTLSVAIEVRGKEIPVFARCECDAADGYEVVGQPEPNPSTVLIDGSKDLLNQVQYIYTTPIDTSSLQAPAVLSDVPLDTSTLPDGVTIDRTTVDVSVRVEQSTYSKTFDNVPISILNPKPGSSVTLVPSTVAITVEGPQREITALTQGDVQAVVDLQERDPGVYQLTPRVILPPEVKYSDPPEAITVTVVVITPTPTATPIPTPTAVPSPTADLTEATPTP